MTKFIIDVIGIIFQLLIVHYFLSYMTNSKPSRKLRYLIYTISFVVMAVSTILPYIKYIFPVLIFFVIIHLSVYYKSKIVIKILYAFLLVLMFFIAEGIVDAFLMIISQAEASEIQKNMLLYSPSVLGSKLIVFFLVKIIGFNKSGIYKNISKIAFIGLLFTPISSLMAMYTISINMENYNDTMSLVIVLSSSILLIISNIFVFYILEKQIQSEHIKARLDFAESQLELQIENYRLLSNQQIEIRKLSHDIKHHIHALKSFDKNESEKHIDVINKKLNEYELFYDTGYPALDALFHAKNIEMKKCGIYFTSSVVLPDKINVDALDLCVILGNALDNAIEACEKIAESENRFVNLRINTYEKYISIHLENSSNENFVPSTEKKTTKKNPIGHGYGLDSIKTIAQKYDGDVNIECENLRFKLSIMLKI